MTAPASFRSDPDNSTRGNIRSAPIRRSEARHVQIEQDTSGIKGTIIASFVLGTIQYARARGLDPRPLFAAAGIAEDTVGDPELRVPTGAWFSIIAHVARVLDDPSLPIRMAQLRRIEDLQLVGFLVLTSASGREAFERVIRYSALLSDASRWTMDVGQDDFTLRIEREGPRTLGHRLSNELAVAGLLQTQRVVSGRATVPARVVFRHAAPPDTTTHDSFFGTAIEWSGSFDGVALPIEMLDAAAQSGNPELHAYLERQAQARLEALGSASSIAARVREVIVRELPSGSPSMTSIAKRLGQSERTMRRWLDDEGTSFRDQVDLVRKARADELLRDRAIPLSQVAFLLGFSDQAAFSRAFRRWFEQSPSEYRIATSPRRAG
jgi:AraC-like DNA-binding protein